jgi:hypothetical protein
MKSMCTLTPKEPCVEQSRICKNSLFPTGDVKVVCISIFFLHHPHGLNVIVVKGNDNYNVISFKSVLIVEMRP